MNLEEQARWTRIEHAVDALAGGQIKQGESLVRIEVALERTIHEYGMKLQKLLEFQAVLMESQNSTWAALGQLAGEQRALAKAQEALTEAQEATESKLNALIDTVDRIIRDRNR